MVRECFHWYVAVGWTVAATAQVHGQCGYTIEFITEPCGPNNWQIFAPDGAINDLGQIGGNTGCVFGSQDAFTWDGSGSIDFIEPWPQSSAYIEDMNDHFEVTGAASIADDDMGSFAFLLTANEAINLGIPKGGTFSVAYALNNHQQVVGRWGNGVTGPGQRAILWERGVMLDLGRLVGDSESSRAEDINETGTLVGHIGPSTIPQAFMLRDRQVTLLGPIPGGYSSEANAVNSFDDIVGVGRLNVPCGFNPDWTSHAFIWRDGVMEDLGVLPGMCRSNALDINNMGQVVGFSGNELESAPFLWQNGKMINLYSFVPPNLNLLLGWAFSINNAGQILVPAGNYDTGVHSLAVFTPIPKVSGDFSCDGLVNELDLIAIINTWGQAGGVITDLTGDGAVGAADLAELLANWSVPQ